MKTKTQRDILSDILLDTITGKEDILAEIPRLIRAVEKLKIKTGEQKKETVIKLTKLLIHQSNIENKEEILTWIDSDISKIIDLAVETSKLVHTGFRLCC